MPRIALFQPTTGIDPAANAAKLVAAASAAKAGGAAMLFTPEMSGLLDRDLERAATSIAGEDDDRVLAAMREAATAHGLWIHLGSLAIRRSDGKLSNRAFVIDPAGAIRARYDKIHMFDVDLPTGERWRESNSYAAGGEAVVVDGTPLGRLGLAICYDMRFPALFERLAEAGADCLSVPAAFTVPTGKAHWHILLRQRAIEAQAFLVAAAQCGQHEDGRETFGHSLVVDPWGQVLLDQGEAPGLGFADVDLAQIAAVRAQVPALSHRRTVAPAIVR
ncbi:MAG: carbon-nitrogen hydrolase family protein [Sphingomicrobium sp.]